MAIAGGNARPIRPFKNTLDYHVDGRNQTYSRNSVLPVLDDCIFVAFTNTSLVYKRGSNVPIFLLYHLLCVILIPIFEALWDSYTSNALLRIENPLPSSRFY